MTIKGSLQVSIAIAEAFLMRQKLAKNLHFGGKLGRNVVLF